MKLGFDIDDVLAEFMSALLKFTTPILGKEFNKDEMVYKQHYGEVWGVTLERAIEIVTGFYNSDEFLKIKPAINSKEVLEKLIADGHELFAITSRPDFIQNQTLNWLNQEFGKIFNNNNTFFTSRFYGEKQSKGLICKNLNIDYFVDDDSHHIISCLENNIKVILYDKPWNWDFPDTNPLVKRIKNLSEIEDTLII